MKKLEIEWQVPGGGREQKLPVRGGVEHAGAVANRRRRGGGEGGSGSQGGAGRHRQGHGSNWRSEQERWMELGGGDGDGDGVARTTSLHKFASQCGSPLGQVSDWVSGGRIAGIVVVLT